MDSNYKTFVRIQNLTFSIYANTNVIKGLANIEKPFVLFLNKTKHIIKPTSTWFTWNNFRFFKTLCTRGSLMTKFTNFDMEKNLKYIFTSNKMLVIHKWSMIYTNKHTITKHVMKVGNNVMLMLNFICWKLDWWWESKLKPFSHTLND